MRGGGELWCSLVASLAVAAEPGVGVGAWGGGGRGAAVLRLLGPASRPVSCTTPSATAAQLHAHLPRTPPWARAPRPDPRPCPPPCPRSRPSFPLCSCALSWDVPLVPPQFHLGSGGWVAIKKLRKMAVTIPADGPVGTRAWQEAGSWQPPATHTQEPQGPRWGDRETEAHGDQPLGDHSG